MKQLIFILLFPIFAFGQKNIIFQITDTQPNGHTFGQDKTFLKLNHQKELNILFQIHHTLCVKKFWKDYLVLKYHLQC